MELRQWSVKVHSHLTGIKSWLSKSQTVCHHPWDHLIQEQVCASPLAIQLLHALFQFDAFLKLLTFIKEYKSTNQKMIWCLMEFY